MAARWEAFGWNVHEVDGHNVSAIRDTIANLDFAEGAPHVLIAHTTFGKGVSYMENQIKWHYWPMSDDEYATALAEIDILESGDSVAEPPLALPHPSLNGALQ